MDHESVDKEYIMLRTELLENLKYQDRILEIVFPVIAALNIYNFTARKLSVLAFMLFFLTIVELNLLQHRNTVYYISTYMSVFLEENSSYKWETRIRTFKQDVYNIGNTIPALSKPFNRFTINFGRHFKHFLLLVLGLFIAAQMILLIYINPDSIPYSSLQQISFYCYTGIFTFLNFLCTLAIICDSNLYDTYLEEWKSIKEMEVSDIK